MLSSLRRLSAEQIDSLKSADDVLKSEFICLSRIREPLGVVGGYWNVDDEAVCKIASGSLDEAIEGLEAMRDYFVNIRGTNVLAEDTNRDIEKFVARVNDWIRVNRLGAWHR